MVRKLSVEDGDLLITDNYQLKAIFIKKPTEKLA
jgi:hypothetical protein